MKTQKILVGFSTEQQTTNYIPFIALNIDKLICLETEWANRKKLTQGISTLLKDKLEIHSINSALEQDIVNLADTITDLVKDHESVYFNIGGGQKTHALALWECFRRRGKDDVVVYANVTTKQIEKYRLQNNTLQVETAPLALDFVPLSDILMLYGFQVKDHSFVKLYRNGERAVEFGTDIITEQQANLITHEKVRMYAFNSQKEIRGNESSPEFDIYTDGNLKAQVLEIISAKNNDVAESIFLKKVSTHNFFSLLVRRRRENDSENKEEKAGYGIYAEDVLIYHFMDFLKKNKNNLCISEAYANIKVVPLSEEKREQKEGEGEYDLLMVTNDCRLIAFEVKTYWRGLKDLKSRLHTLHSVAGRYVDYKVIIPYFQKDVKENMKKSQSNWWWKQDKNQLRKLPQLLVDNKVDFFAITDSISSFFITKDGTAIANQSAESIEIRPVQQLFKSVLLKKPAQ